MEQTWLWTVRKAVAVACDGGMGAVTLITVAAVGTVAVKTAVSVGTAVAVGCGNGCGCGLLPASV